MMRCLPIFIVTLLTVACFSGCVQRTISITSQPAGALVYLNDEEVGRTPLTVPFTYYGTYDVRLEKDGHQPLWTTAKADAPWWENPGPDLVGEAIPRNRVKINWHFDLTQRDPADETGDDRLIDRAKQMRATTASPGSATRPQPR